MRLTDQELQELCNDAHDDAAEEIRELRAQLAAAEARAERYRHLIADIKHWDMSQFMTIPHPLRERMQAALSEGEARDE